MKSDKSWWIPASSFSLATVLSILCGSGIRIQALRAFQETTCFASATLKSAVVKGKALTFDVEDGVTIRVDAQAASKISFGPTLMMQLTVHVEAAKPSAKTLDLIINVNESFEPKTRERTYNNPVGFVDSFNGFRLSLESFKDQLNKTVKAAIKDFNKGAAKGDRFPADNATISISSIANNPLPTVTLDGTYVCIAAGQGHFTGATVSLTLNAAGTGTGAGGTAGTFP